jgi:hypothetical protein
MFNSSGIISKKIFNKIDVREDGVIKKYETFMKGIVYEFDTDFFYTSSMDKKKINVKDEICCICMGCFDTEIKFVILFCGHIYHKNCLE